MEDLSPVDNLRRQIILFQKNCGHLTIKVKPLCLTRDIRPLHRWMNMEYAKLFWQMNWPYSKLYKHYEWFINSGIGYPLMFFINNKIRPVALMDVYLARKDEVAQHYDAGAEDFGVHLLMGPNNKRIPALTTNIMITGLSFLFSLGVERIIGEPDVNNKNANALVKRVGFKWIKQIELSYKTANLYFCEKKEFLKAHPSG